MPAYRFISLGDIVVYEGHEYDIVAVSGSRVTLVGRDHFARLSLLAGQLVDDIEIVGHVPLVNPPDTSLTDAGITGRDARDAEAWHDVVLLLTTGRDSRSLPDDPVNPDFDPALLKSIRVGNAIEYLRNRGVAAKERTVYNMCTRWAASPTRLSFVDRRKLQQPAFQDDRRRLLWDKTRDVLEAHRGRPDIDDKFLLAEVRDLVGAQEPGFVFPSYATQAKYLNRIKAQLHWKATARKRASASQRPAEGFGVMGASRPGEFVHADSTKLACFLRDKYGNRARYELSILLDVFSTAVLAFALAPTTSALTIVRLIARASFPRSLRPYGFRLIDQEESESGDNPELAWDPDLDAPPFVAIETLVVDNGQQYTAELTQRVAESLGCGIRFSRKYTPEDKAKVEKAFKDIEHRLVQVMPGFTGASVENAGGNTDEDLLDHVVMVELLQDFFDDVWANTRSRGLSDPFVPSGYLTPNQALTTATAIAPSIPIPDVGENYVRLLEHGFRVIEHYGVDVAGNKYDSPELSPLYLQPSGDTRHNNKYLVAWDPDFPVVVWVMDPHRNRWIMCGWKRMGDLGRPFAKEVFRGAAALASGVITDEVRAAKELVAKYERYQAPANAKKARTDEGRTEADMWVARRPQKRAPMSWGADDVRLIGGDEEIEIGTAEGLGDS